MAHTKFALILVVFCSWPLCGTLGDFVRGDANRDGRVNVSDAVHHLLAVLLGDVPIDCEDAADSNDDGLIDISDAVATLRSLFGRTGDLPYPGTRDNGPDPTCDEIGCGDVPQSTPAIVLSEIQYNPRGADERLEFIELYNRTTVPIDVGGYEFTDGVLFTIPEGTVIPGGEFLLVLGDPDDSRWRRFLPRTGPYQGALSNKGEVITVRNGDCMSESLEYDDRPPWSLGADGYGPSLERVDYLSPAEDSHSWLPSPARTRADDIGGTPGDENAALGTATRPSILSFSVEPQHPGSDDEVAVTVTLGLPPEAIERVTLRWEQARDSARPPVTSEMSIERGGLAETSFVGTIPPVPSQTMVRFGFEVERVDGTLVYLPPLADMPPVLSYFVYDGEMEAKLPILWLMPLVQATRINPTRRRVLTGAVIKEPDQKYPQVFDGAQLTKTRGGLALKFLKGAEYRDDRTVKIVPEQGGGGSGTRAPHMEHLGFELWRDLGGLAPWSRWFRTVDYGSRSQRHAQRAVIQHVNERFLEMNGVEPDGDLYKLDHFTGFVPEKKTNGETGDESYQGLLGDLRDRRPLEEFLDLENIRSYSAISVLIDNWDGFHQNYYFYHDLTPTGRWMMIPWDLDQVFRCVRFPVTFPRNGSGTCESRSADRRLFTQPYHTRRDLDELYREELRLLVSPGGLFTQERLEGKIQELEDLLLEDLALQEAYLGVTRRTRRNQIVDAYRFIRVYIQRRVAYLRSILD